GGSPEVEGRLADYVVYTRYVELSLATGNGSKSDHAGPAGELDRLIYRFRHSPAINSGGYYFDLGRSGRAGKPATDGPSGPLGRDEALAWVRSGVASNRVSPFDPVLFSADLVPWTGPTGKLVGTPSV